MRKARDIYKKHGGKGEELYLVTGRTPRHNLMDMWELFCSIEDDDVWIGIDAYTDEEHCRNVMKAVDDDSDLEPLYKNVVKLVGAPERIIRAQCDNVDY
jgi:hypothetical protein